MKKRIVLLCIALLSMTSAIHAQTARILDVAPQGYVVEIQGNDMKETNLYVKVKVQYSKVADDEAACIVLMSKTPFPAITNMDQLYKTYEKYDVGEMVLEETVQQRTAEVDVLVPFQKIKTTDKATRLYLQAIVIYDGKAIKVLAKSQVMKVEVKDLTIVDVFRSEKDIERFSSILSSAVGVGLDAMSDNTCPNCRGKGEVEEQASYGTYMRTCYYCDGTGRDPASSDSHAGSSEGNIFDLLGIDLVKELGISKNSKQTNTQSKSKKSTNTKSTKQTNRQKR